MKKIILTAIFAVIAMVSVNAQTSFGVKAGVNFGTAKESYDNYDYSEDETGFYIGAFADVNLNEDLDLQPGFNYVSFSDADLDLIQIPIAFNFEAVENFNLLAGPNFGFLLDPVEGIDSFNLSLDLGLSYNFIPNLFVEARYNLGLSNLVDKDYYFDNDAKVKLHGFQIGLGYKF